MNSRISPDEPFPADLGRLRDQDVEVLNSKIHREIDHEFATAGEIDAETAARKDELDDELDDRDAGPRLTLVPQQDDSGIGNDDGNDDAGKPARHVGGPGQVRR